MAAKLYDLVRQTVTTGGSSDLVLGGAVTGWLTVALAGGVGGDTITYFINDPGTSPTNSEIGRVTYLSSNTGVTGRQVLASTNANATIAVTTNAHFGVCAAREDFAGDWCNTHANFSGL